MSIVDKWCCWNVRTVDRASAEVDDGVEQHVEVAEMMGSWAGELVEEVEQDRRLACRRVELVDLAHTS